MDERDYFKRDQEKVTKVDPLIVIGTTNWIYYI